MKRGLEKIDTGHCGMLEASGGESGNNSSMPPFTYLVHQQEFTER